MIDKMLEMIIPIITFVLGFWSKHLLDNRDLRRKILEPTFISFEDTITYLQNNWRAEQRENINNHRYDNYVTNYNEGKNKLIESKEKIIYACKKIREKRMIELIEKSFDTILQAVADYHHFISNRDTAEQEERKELLNALKDANEKFDKVLPEQMEKVYDRYWVLMTNIFVN